MASVYCGYCKAKITQGDATCPSCGSPTSKLIPVVLCLVVVAASVMLYNAYRQFYGSHTVVVSSESEITSDHTTRTSSVGMVEE